MNIKDLVLSAIRVTAISCIYIIYLLYDFYSEALPTMYVAVADHLAKANPAEVFTEEAFKTMQDGKLTDEEYHQLYGVGLLESGYFKQVDQTTFTRNQAKQLLINSL